MRCGYPDNAQICARTPHKVCTTCEMVLCFTHSETCETCKETVCEGCEALHEQMHSEAKEVLDVLADNIDRLRAEIVAYKARHPECSSSLS